MTIPKIYSKKNRTYSLLKQINDNMFLYQEINYGYKECFSRLDLTPPQNNKRNKGVKAKNG